MKLIITDTNVFFDIISVGALPAFFALDYEICTTDFVVKEILESDQKLQIESFIKSKKLNPAIGLFCMLTCRSRIFR